MAALSVQDVVRTGLAASYASAAAGGDTIAVSGNTNQLFAHVKNASGASVNVTVTRQNTTANVGGEGSVTLSNLVVAVPAGAERFIGPFTPSLVDSTGNVNLGYSAVTSLTVAALRLPPV